MLRDVLEVKPLPDYKLWLRFDDGAEGTVDLKKQIRFQGVFEPLKQEREFNKVFVHPEYFVVTWPNGADLDSEVLYSLATNTPIGISNS